MNIISLLKALNNTSIGVERKFSFLLLRLYICIVWCFLSWGFFPLEKPWPSKGLFNQIVCLLYRELILFSWNSRLEDFKKCIIAKRNFLVKYTSSCYITLWYKSIPETSSNSVYMYHMNPVGHFIFCVNLILYRYSS